MTELRAGAATDVGLVRANNQDQLLMASPLFAVADGMGGHAAGEVAAATAVQALDTAFAAADAHTPATLAEAAEDANRAVWEQAQRNPELRGMGTTLVAVALVGGEDDRAQVAVVNVGDSRVYLLRGGELQQVTADHSLVAEMVAEGQLAQEEAEFHPQRHVLTRALGVDPDVAVDLTELDPLPGDRYLLCSDGLSREVADEQVAAVLRTRHDPAEAARELVEEAKHRGGNDNITVVVVDVHADGGERHATPAEETGASAVVAPLPTPPGYRDDTVAAPALVTDEPSAAPGRRERRRQGRAERPPTARPITWRVVGFFVLLLAILGGAAAAVGWYARASYFVGLRSGELIIFQGRPGGVLWFEPTVAEATGVATSQVETRHLPALRSGQPEPDLTAARQYVQRLRQEELAAQLADQPPPVPPTTPTTPTTAAPSGSTTVAS